MFVYACKTGSQKSTITGTISNLPNTEIRILSLDTNLHIDTIVPLNDGKFSFNLNVKEPTPFVFNVKEPNEIAFIFIEPGNVTIKGESGAFNVCKVSGSKSQTEFEEYQKSIAPLIQRGALLKNRGDSATSQAAIDAVMTEAAELDSLQGNSIIDFVKKHPTSPVSSFLIFTQLDRSGADLKKSTEFYSLLKGDALKTFFGQQLTQNIQKLKQLSVGEEAPNFTLPNTQGTQISLASLKGKYVLIDFWASWCKPCREENPNVVNAYAQFKDKGFEILGVSLDEDADKWKEAIAKDNLTWPQVSDLKGWASPIAGLYSINSIPNNYLLDKDGKIIAIGLREEALINKLKELMP